MRHPRYTKHTHHFLVMAGIFTCSYVVVCLPELGHLAHGLSVLTNLIWLWEPEA